MNQWAATTFYLKHEKELSDGNQPAAQPHSAPAAQPGSAACSRPAWAHSEIVAGALASNGP